MAFFPFLFLLLFAFIPISATRPPPDITVRPPLDYRKQLDNVIDALIGADDFSNWAYLLSFIDSSILPLSATFFIPTNNATTTPTPTSTTTNTANLDTSTFRYHIVPQRLSFSDLQLFKSHDRLPTLLPNNTIIITNNSHSNFSLDESQLTHPDVYANDLITVHGVSGVLDYKVFGGIWPKAPPPQAEVDGPPLGMGVPAVTDGQVRSSDAAAAATIYRRGFAMAAAILCAVCVCL